LVYWGSSLWMKWPKIESNRPRQLLSRWEWVECSFHPQYIFTASNVSINFMFTFMTVLKFHIISTVNFDNNSQFLKSKYYQVLFNSPYIFFGSSWTTFRGLCSFTLTLQ
jgi:hypothetical protein